MTKRKLVMGDDLVLRAQSVPEAIPDGATLLESKPGTPEDFASPVISIPTGFRRFGIGVGLSITHEKQIYNASPEGWVDLPAGEDWYFPMVHSGVLKEIFDHESQTELV